jgi:membrane protease YdiL (CAAX protease family)
MSSDALSGAVGNILLLAGVYVYVSLIRQISARPPSFSTDAPKTFGLPEAVVAALLTLFLLLSVIGSIKAPSPALTTRDLVLNLVLVIVVLLILVGFLQFRGFDLDALAGFSKIGVIRAIATGAVLLLAAYPLINLADAITQRILGSGSSKQNIVELFNGSHTIQQRIMIICMAVAIAPIAEEFVFRFFLYGVLKRYVGRSAGLILSALLFAAVHAHLPSFGPLFVLGVCFALAYEWSGSILVSMTMHSLFNSLSLIVLAFPQFSER